MTAWKVRWIFLQNLAREFLLFGTTTKISAKPGLASWVNCFGMTRLIFALDSLWLKVTGQKPEVLLKQNPQSVHA